MLKQILFGLCALAVAGTGYGTVMAADSAVVYTAYGPITVVVTRVVTSAPSTEKAAVDVKNTKCIVMADDDVGDETVTYKGKIYHFCCSTCVKAFNKDPDKYVKAFEAAPATYGVPAAK